MWVSQNWNTTAKVQGWEEKLCWAWTLQTWYYKYTVSELLSSESSNSLITFITFLMLDFINLGSFLKPLLFSIYQWGNTWLSDLLFSLSTNIYWVIIISNINSMRFICYSYLISLIWNKLYYIYYSATCFF